MIYINIFYDTKHTSEKELTYNFNVLKERIRLIVLERVGTQGSAVSFSEAVSIESNIHADYSISLPSTDCLLGNVISVCLTKCITTPYNHTHTQREKSV